MVRASCLSSDLDTKGVYEACRGVEYQADLGFEHSPFSETRHFIYFYVGVLSFLIWKS